MRKTLKLLSLFVIALSISACSCKKEENFKSVLENSTQVSNRVLTTQEVYNFIRENEDIDPKLKEAFVTRLMATVLDITNNATNKQIYNLKVKEAFKTLLESEEYKINGVFNEDLFVASLKTNLYKIDTSKTLTSGPTYELGLTYDYSDYISKSLDYNIYFEMIKEEYIAKNRKDLLDNSKTRIISVFSLDDLDEMEKIVEDLFDGKYTNLDQIAKIKKDEAIEEIGRQYCLNLGYENEYYEGTCSASTSSSTYDSALSKFTTCENGVRCNPSDGLAYQIKLINETDYITEQVVNKNTTDILYTKALEQLFRSDVNKHLKPVIAGEDAFLINPLYNDNPNFNEKDIILFDGSAEKYYLVTVRVVDSNTQTIEDREKGYAELLTKISDSILVNYLKTLNVEVTDPVLKQYYNDLIGKK